MTNKNIWNNPFPTLFPSDLFKKMDEFFQDLESFNVDDLRLTLGGHPRGDMYVNKDGKLIMKFTLAGYSKEQLSVSVDGNKLVISATKSEEDEGDNSTLARRAFKKTFTDFARCWDLETAEVSYKDGLLKIVVSPLQQKENVSKALDII